MQMIFGLLFITVGLALALRGRQVLRWELRRRLRIGYPKARLCLDEVVGNCCIFAFSILAIGWGGGLIFNALTQK